VSDTVTPEVRSRMMSGIRAKNTKPELAIRKRLHALGFRYRIHDKRKPGKPDIVLPRYHAVILIHGCFWHGHDCHLFRIPATRQEFWQPKIEHNRLNDQKALEQLLHDRWRVLIIWECSIKGKQRLPVDEVIKTTVEWLQSDDSCSCIRGEVKNNVCTSNR